MPINIKSSITSILISFTILVHGQNSDAYQVKISAQQSAIMDKESDYFLFVNKYITPFEISFSKHLTGDEIWKQMINHPRAGVSFMYAGLQNKEVLGTIYATRGFLEIPLYHRKHFSFIVKPLVGLAYATRTFNPVDNYKNLLIGTHVLANFGIEGLINVNLGGRFSIHTGVAFNHFSNGQIKLPNNGLNLTGIKAGLGYSFGSPVSETDIHTLTSSDNHEWNLLIIPTAGIKQIDFFYNDYFYTASISVEATRNINFLQNTGLGIALFYDESNIVDYGRKFFTPISSSHNYIGGIYLHHDFNFYPVIIPVQMGYYALNAKAEYRSKIFNRFGVRWHVTPNLFLNIMHKSDFFFRGDNIEWGIGYKI